MIKTEMIFMGEKFIIEWGVSFELMMVLTGLMVCGKEYYDLMKSAKVSVDNEKLQVFIDKKFGGDVNE